MNARDTFFTLSESTLCVSGLAHPREIKPKVVALTHGAHGWTIRGDYGPS